MAGIFKRLFTLGQSHAHSVVDKIEDPIKMTEQGIRDLKKDLEASMRSLAEVKSVAIKLKREAEDQRKLGADYERKAMLLLQKMQEGSLSNDEAERLATEALSKKRECDERGDTLTGEYDKQKQLSDKLQGDVSKLKSTVSTYENELITLKARARTAASTRKINQHLSKMDTSGTIGMLEKMKEKVKEEESLSQAYGEIVSQENSIDDEINKALTSSSKHDANDSLLALKAKMGI